MIGGNSVGTALPDKPARVPVQQLSIKEAVGIALWNGHFGPDVRIYLARTKHPENGEEIVRFFGGTSVPTSAVSAWNQSLIWIQEYFQEAISQEAITGYLSLHRAFYFQQPMYESSLDKAELSVSTVPGYEVHGVLKSTPAFRERHAEKLVELKLSVNGVDLCPHLPISNVMQGKIAKRILEQLRNGELACAVEIHLRDVRGRNTVSL